MHPIVKNKNIVYAKSSGLKLDIFGPQKKQEAKPVLVFIHGGNWISGHKDTYSFFGKGFARKGIVTVVIDYRLSPDTNYQGMVEDAAKALQWVHQNISSYGGDSSKIYVSGHSAGGHLAALLATDLNYTRPLKLAGTTKGTILIDAFGLDMFDYLSHSRFKKDAIYYPTFSKDPETWKAASPQYHLQNNNPPFLLFLGGSTYPAIKSGTHNFMTALQNTAPETKLVNVKGRGHIAMIFQFVFPKIQAYKEILNFMKQ
jgi:acetyl esterase/lipase